MRAALEKLLCRTKHQWGEWYDVNENNIHRHCLRKSCDKTQKISYSEYIMYQAVSKVLLKRLTRPLMSFKAHGGKTIKWRRYGIT